MTIASCFIYVFIIKKITSKVFTEIVLSLQLVEIRFIKREIRMVEEEKICCLKLNLLLFFSLIGYKTHANISI